MEYKKQVEKSHYSFQHYFLKERWMSYWYQVKEITSRDDIVSVLDIGPGTTFLRDMLKMDRPSITYKTLDIAEDVSPDFIGGVTSIPLPDNSYYLVSAFQVLEHIQFTDFEDALKEMKRVSKKYVFVSLPHFGPSVELLFKIPFFSRVRLAAKIPYPMRHIFGGQHHWEVGKRGYDPKTIRAVLRKHFDILDEYVPFENQYHHFYIMQKKWSE